MELVLQYLLLLFRRSCRLILLGHSRRVGNIHMPLLVETLETMYSDQSETTLGLLNPRYLPD